MRDYSIGELATETGVKVPTIRYYEGIGLIPEPGRTLKTEAALDNIHGSLDLTLGVPWVALPALCRTGP